MLGLLSIKKGKLYLIERSFLETGSPLIPSSETFTLVEKQKNVERITPSHAPTLSI